MWWTIFSLLFATVFCQKPVIRIYSITTITVGETGRSIVPAQQLYLDLLNQDDSVFAEYEFELVVLDSKASSVEALRHALFVSQYEDNLIVDANDGLNGTEYVIPFILGCPWSGLSVSAAPVLSGFNFGQISSGATSVALSNTGDYPYFHRSVPDDDLQAAAVVRLCRMFGWTRIAVMYINNNYGVYFAASILNLAAEADELGQVIETYSMSFESFDLSSYRAAAKEIKDLGVFVTVLIAYGEEVYNILTEGFEYHGILGYPYYYIGTESWFYEAAFQEYNYAQHVQGFIGTIPWRPTDDFDYSDYASIDPQLGAVYNASQKIYDNVIDLWDNAYQTNPELVYNISIPGIWSFYGWESATALGETLKIYDNLYGLESIWDGSYAQSDVVKKLQNILLNMVNFIGVTGNVSFDDNGDREGAFYLFSNVIDTQGTINFFGIYSFDFETEVNPEDLVWPNYFAANGLESPLSETITTTKVVSLNSGVVTAMLVFLFLSIGVAVVFLAMLLQLKDHKSIKAVSWKLNIISIIGGILMLVSVCLFSVDDASNYKPNLDVNCNFRVWLLVISFTLLFLPFFLKTFRIARIFNVKELDAKKISDLSLIYATAACVVVDVIILASSLGPWPLTWQYQDKGGPKYVDELQRVQQQYGVCEKTYSFTFTLVTGLWKAAQLFFGTYAAMTVSQIVGFKQIARFDETGSQILAIFLTMSLLCIMASAYFFSDAADIDFHFILISILCMLSVNITLLANIGMRLYYVAAGKDSQYLVQAEEKMDAWYKMMYEQTRKIARQKGWIEESVSPHKKGRVKQGYKKAKSKVKSLAKRGTGSSGDDGTCDDEPESSKMEFSEQDFDTLGGNPLSKKSSGDQDTKITDPETGAEVADYVIDRLPVTTDTMRSENIVASASVSPKGGSPLPDMVAKQNIVQVSTPTEERL